MTDEDRRVDRTYDKLVRGRIPELIEDDGERAVTHVAADDEYERRLREKLVEEAVEFRENGDLEELADVRDVMEAILTLEDESMETVAGMQREKRERRGGFDDRIVLDGVEE